MVGVCRGGRLYHPETRCSFLPIAQPLALFVAHSAFISLSVTSEAFAMKPKPRLISPISPICPNPETRKAYIRIPETSALLRFLATSAFALGSMFLYRFYIVYYVYCIYLRPPKPLHQSETWWSLASSWQLGKPLRIRATSETFASFAELGKPFHLLATFLPFLLSSQLTAFYVRDRLRY